MDIHEKATSIGRMVDDFLLKVLRSNTSDDLYEIVKHQVATGGKRIRPAMTILSCMAVGSDDEVAIPAAAAVELVHNYTLIFDDIIDRSDLRRGLPTVRTKYDTVMAILAGMHYREAIFQATKQSLKRTEIEEILSAAIIDIVEGERLDVLFEQAGRESEYINKMMRRSIDEKDYKEMIGKKTAVLFETACKIGGVVGNGTSTQVDGLSRFGWNCGLAFQLTDDLLDIAGKKDQLGKETGKDIKEHKLGNFVILNSLQELSQIERNKLLGILRSPIIGETEVNEAVGIISSTSAVARTLEASVDYASRAKASLDELPPSEPKRALLSLPDFITKRSC